MNGMQYRMLLFILGAAHGSSMVVDSEDFIESEKAARARQVKDAAVFDSFDFDKSGFLEANEMAVVIEKAGIDTAAFDWHKFDSNKDGRLSADEFVMAGPAAQVAKFSKDQSALKQGDLDHPSFLEAKEMGKVLEAVGIDPEGFNWHAFDHDGDGRLSEEEFRLVRRSVEDSGPMPREAARTQQVPKLVFKALDVNNNGVLEAPEVGLFMKDMGIEPEHFNWHSLDTDGDGGLNEKEFIAAFGKAAKQSRLRQVGHPLQEENVHDLMQKDFAEFDKDGNEFLEPAEMQELTKRVGLSPEHFNWLAFDHDGDGRLNFEEFVEADPHYQSHEVQREQPVSAEQAFQKTRPKVRVSPRAKTKTKKKKQKKKLT